MCPKCESKDVHEGKTLDTDQVFCSCPSCGHLWDPTMEKGAKIGEKRTPEEREREEKRLLEEAVDWALEGDLQIFVSGEGYGCIVQFEGKPLACGGWGKTRRKALVHAFRSNHPSEK